MYSYQWSNGWLLADWFDPGYKDAHNLLGSHYVFEEDDLGLEILFNEA